MSMSSESSDGEENAPAMFPFEVFPEEPRIEKTISSHNKKMLATGGKESHHRVLRLSQGIGWAETSNLAQKRKVEGIKEALAVFSI
uniref:Uncharacterized protein n=1 Tax=Ditylenchus dipsaci TaxID=166011 RepID=A0A915E5X8_9BILA